MKRRVLGIMTGTSMDGIDLCLADVDLSAGPHLDYRIHESATLQFSAGLRAAIEGAIAGGVDEVGALHAGLGADLARAAVEFLQDRRVDLVGCHGQTVAHADGLYSLQVGSSAYLAQALMAPVISNFRDADIAAGGNGAPLMPYLDWLLFRKVTETTVTLNLGGVANLAIIRPSADRDDVQGFDTGPGMGLIDEAARALFQKPIDKDGELSGGGSVDAALLDKLMAHPFIDRRPPKSTGRHEFGAVLVQELIETAALSAVDLLRTLVRFTALSIAQNLERSVAGDAKGVCYVSGGGREHPLLRADLEALLPRWQVRSSAEIGIDPDYKEALLMAVLAASFVEQIPGNMPGVSGAREAVILGQQTV